MDNPPVDFDDAIPAKKLAHLLDTSEERLANDRYLGRGIPYVRFGRRILYLRSDVMAYLAANRHDPAQGDR